MAAAALGAPLIARDALVIAKCKGNVNSCAAASGSSSSAPEMKRSAVAHMSLSVLGLILLAICAKMGKADKSGSLFSLMALFFAGSAIWNLSGTNDLTCAGCSDGKKNADGTIAKYGSTEAWALGLNSVSAGMVLVGLLMYLFAKKR